MGLWQTLQGEFIFAAAQVKNLQFLCQTWESQNSYAKGVSFYHGFGVCNFYFHDFLAKLELAGYAARAPNYRSWQDIRETAERQAELLDKRLSRQKESLIGHSQGGLIAVYIAQHYPELVDKVIALGTPFKGTKMAHLVACCEAGRQMLPGSDFLEEMADKELPATVQFYTISSKYDHLIPQERAVLKEQVNVQNLKAPEDIGHARLITLQDKIMELLRK